MSRLSAEERAALVERRDRIERAEREAANQEARKLPFYHLPTAPPLSHALRAVTEGRDPQVIWDAWVAAGYPHPDKFPYPKSELSGGRDDA